MLHVRHNLITADPSQLSDSVKFIENEVRPNVENQPGNLGVALQLNPELGVAILESFWVSGDALRVSERVVAPSRAAAVRRATGTVTVERYAVPVFELEAPLRSGEGVRVTRMDVAPSAVEDTIEVIGDTAVPRLADIEGFCSALFFIDRTAGHSIIETLWRDPAGAGRQPQRRRSHPGGHGAGHERRDPRGGGVPDGVQLSTEILTSARPAGCANLSRHRHRQPDDPGRWNAIRPGRARFQVRCGTSGASMRAMPPGRA